MTQWINYHHLYYFKTVAEEGSVSKAAAKLRIGQPTLSAQLKQFEDHLGISLFERQHKKLILTEQGKIALDYSRSIFKIGSEMYEVLHDRLKPQKPSLHIGALDSVPKQIVLQIVKQAYKFSSCQITLSEGKADELIRELTSHRIDIVVTNFLPIESSAKGLIPKVITKKNVALYGSEKYKPLRKNFPKSISGQPIILPTYDSKMRFDLDHWAKTHSLELNTIAESQDIGIKKLMAVSEMGMIPTATHTVTEQVLAGQLLEIGVLSGVYEELILLMAQRKLPNPIATKIFENFNI